MSLSAKGKLFYFIKSVLLLSATGLVLRSVSVYFNIYLSQKLGSEGMGLYTLICSVYSFAITFATSAVNLASTRLVSEALGRDDHKAVRSCMLKCICYSLFFGISAFLLLNLSAPIIALKVLKDARTLRSLRAFALSLPCMALSSCFSGYFTAVRRVSKNAVVQFSEQGVRVSACVIAFSFFAPESIENACLFVVLGGVIADFSSLLYNTVMYIFDLKRHIGRRGENENSSTLLGIALPVALSSYLRSALVSIEHMLIPRGLQKSGLDKSSALKKYGVMQAMALPVVMFPYALLSPTASLIIPEVAQRRASGDSEGIRRITHKIISFVLIFGIGCGAIISFYSGELGLVFCKSLEGSAYIKALAPILPIMYLDTLTDAILKGIDCQTYTMRINILDSFLSVIAVFFLVPVLGIYGYIAEIIICELINASLSVYKLIKTVGVKVNIFKFGIIPLFSAIASLYISKLILSFLPLFEVSLTFVILKLLLTAVIYLLFIKLFVKIT